MAGYGGYYKGEKKKPKKDKQKSVSLGSSQAPVFTLPEVISKKRPNE